MKTTVKTCVYQSPLGELLLGEWQGCLCLCDWLGGDRDFVLKRILRQLSACRTPATTYREVEAGESLILAMAVHQLDEYFQCRRREFSVPLCLCGTEWQRQVWQALTEVPYGQTMGYSQLARRIGHPTAARAVAAAARANAISVLVPCHRLVGADGSIVGYAGGTDVKRALITLENPDSTGLAPALSV